MNFNLQITKSAEEQIQKIMADPSRIGLQRQLKKAFKILAENPKHPELKSHPLGDCDGVKVWTSYAQNNTPQAYRILWSYGDDKGSINIISCR